MFELQKLENDVRVLTAQREGPSATALVMFGVGSRFEAAEQCGIAHFSEHMFFKGTDRRKSARDISVEIDGIGGEFNAFTGKEYTGYYVKCAAEHLELSIDVLSDMLLHSKFDPDEINREKGVILEEMNMYRDTPMRYIGNVYDDLLYGDTPLGWDIVGTEQVIKGATHDLFKGFLNRWYTGNRCVVGLAGNVSDTAKASVHKLFGDIPASTQGTASPAQWQQDGPRVKIWNKASEQAHIAVGLRAPSQMSDDRYVIQVLNAVLGGGMSSRLFTEVRERRGLCYYVRSYHDAYTDAGSLVVQSGVDTDRIDMAVTAILEELWKLLDAPVPADELRKAKNFLKGRLVLAIEDPQGLVMFGARREAVEGGYVEPSEVLNAIEAVTADDIMRVAREILQHDQLNLAAVGPYEDEDRFRKLLDNVPATVA